MSKTQFLRVAVFSTSNDQQPIMLCFRPHASLKQMKEAYAIAGYQWEDKYVEYPTITVHSDLIAAKLRALPFMCESMDQVATELRQPIVLS